MIYFTFLFSLIFVTFQKSDEPPYDNWRRSDIYSAPGDSWDRSYKVLPGEEVEDS